MNSLVPLSSWGTRWFKDDSLLQDFCLDGREGIRCNPDWHALLEVILDGGRSRAESPVWYLSG